LRNYVELSPSYRRKRDENTFTELILVTDIAVKLDPETGAATIELRGAAVAEPRFRLRDIATEKFLTRRGWSKTATHLPGEAVTAADFTVLVLDADLARRITAGTNLSLEQPASNIFATITWPDAGGVAEVNDVPAAAAPIPVDLPDEPEVTPEEQQPVEDTAAPLDAPDEMTAAAEEDAARLKKEADGEVEGSEKPDEPVSLEPPIREEATTPYLAAAPVVADAAEPRYRPILEDEEEDDRGTPWGKLAAAAVFFMLLGAVLTYFWQSSAYENELRTAMRAVESQRDQQVADARADAGESSDTLSSQAAALAKDRDAALSEVSEQQAKVKGLEERLLTAQGDIESLKAAAQSSATEQTTVFNDRIDVLGKELETARKQLAQSAQDLAAREASLREVQSQLAVVKLQNESLEQLAGKAAQSDLERKTLADRITELTGLLDKSDRDLAARDAELKKTATSLDAANALVQSNADELERLKTAAAADSPAEPVADIDRASIVQERDLYAADLKAMTKSFNDLKLERDRLASALEKAQLQAQNQSQTAGQTEAQTAELSADPATETRATWGGTAIDQLGAVYSRKNQVSEKAATDAAIALCRSRSQGRCEPLRTYQNSCFSLARIEGEGPRNDNFGFSVNKDRRTAEAAAKRECEQLGGGCTVRITACSPDAAPKAANQ
jgi:hypothetical protein